MTTVPEGTGLSTGGPGLPGSAGDLADEWLIGQVVSGRSGQALEVLVRRHQARVFRLAYRVLGDRSDAADVAQDVWLQVWSGVAAFAGGSSFSTWLTRITVNRAISLTRRHARRAELPGGDDEDQWEHARPRATDAGQLSETRARRAAIAHAVAGLPAEVRTVFVLRHFEELSYERICEVLDLSEPTVRGRLRRGRVLMAAALAQWQ